MQNTPPWYKSAVFYELNVRAFYDSNGDGIGDLQGVIQKLDYLEYLGINCIWLLPIHPSPLRDGGYDISDYKAVHPDFGTLEDFKQLTSAARERGIRIVTDLVLNHTSDQHHWFQEARKDPHSAYRDYYVWSDDQAKYEGTRIIFIDTEDSNWTWDEQAGQYYWHRFFSHQPDLNYDNPAVHDEMLSVIKFWLDLGIDGFRIDAIPYLYEREGTSSENLDETIAFLRKMREFVDKHYPEAVLLAEANQWPEDTIPYFGQGDILQMAFHFPLMPRIFIALAEQDRAPILEILERTSEIPPESQWCLFLRNHDELTLEMVTEAERDVLWSTYAPEPNMRLNLGIRRRLSPLLNRDLQRILLAHSLILTMPGSPVLYYGDEIGMGDDPSRHDRDGLRTPMQWEPSPSVGFSPLPPEKLFAPPLNGSTNSPKFISVTSQTGRQDSQLERLRHLLHVREQHPLFVAGDFAWANDGLPSTLLAYWRIDKDSRVLALHNLSDQEESFRIAFPGSTVPSNLLTQQPFGMLNRNVLSGQLKAHEFVWLLAPASL